MEIASPTLAAVIKSPPSVDRIRISSRDQWLALRTQDITASVAAALMGIHPYATALSLWALKTGRVMEDPEETGPMRRGRLLEPVAVQLLREDYPQWEFSDHPIGLYYRDPVARIGATPDLFAKNEQGEWGIIQIKSVEPSIFRRDWKREDGLVEPPLWIVVQAIIEAHLTGFEWAAVAPMVVGHGLELPLTPVPLHAGIIERVKGEVAHFWRTVESGQAPDPDYGRDTGLIEKLYAPDGTVIDLSGDNEVPDLVARKEQLASNKTDIEKQQKDIKARLLVKLGSAAAGQMADGRYLSAKIVNRSAYSVGPSSYVDLRIKKTAA
jgi:hypothetical protein